MASYGARLREERERLGVTQEALANRCGVTVQSQRNYEAARRKPDIEYLERAAVEGIEVCYVVTGRRSVSNRPAPADLAVAEEPAPYRAERPLSGAEKLLVQDFRALDQPDKKHVLGVVAKMAKAARPQWEPAPTEGMLTREEWNAAAPPGKKIKGGG